MFTCENLSTLLDEAKRVLRRYPRVLGVGFGCKEIRGRVTQTTALRVYVSEKVRRAGLKHGDVIPPKVCGISTDVIQAATVAPVSHVDASCGVAPSAGGVVTNLRGVLGGAPEHPGSSGLGALGFFAAVNGTSERLDVVLVSNRHVLLAHGARKGDHIYQPTYRDNSGTYEFRRESLRPVAAISDEGHEGHYIYSYPGESPQPYFIDCAAARLCAGSVGGFQTALSADAGRASVRLKGVARAHPFDAFAGRGLRVRKHGPATGLTFGRILDVAAVALASDGSRRENNLLIRAEARGDGACASSFAADGDSGALVFDERKRAVGLLWGRSLRNGFEAFACHLHPVLDRLNVTLLTYDPNTLSGTRPHGSPARAL